MKDLNGAGEFDQSIKSGLSLVDFWAPWCGPCNAMSPILKQLEQSEIGKVFLFYKINIDNDANQLLASKFFIRSIPTVIIFKNGLEIARNVGAFSNYQNLETWIKSVLKAPSD